MSKDWSQFPTETAKEIADYAKELDEERDLLQQDLDKEFDAIGKAIEKYIKTRKYDSNVFGSLKTEDLIEKPEKPAQKRKGRKPSALKDVNETVPEKIKIKKEKISDVHSTTSLSSASLSSLKENVPIKTEVDEMPAPTWIPPAKKRLKEVKTERPSRSVRTTRTKGRKAADDSSTDRNSDVVIQNANISTVSLSDTEDSDSERTETKETTTRSTRTKTKTRQKQISDSSQENSRSQKEIKEESSQSEAEDMGARTTRTKPRKKEMQEEIEKSSTRSTRTKTIKNNAEKEANNNKKQEEDESDTKEKFEDLPLETRTTRTKTVKKNVEKETNNNKKQEEDELDSKEKGEDVPLGTRSTRTKTNKKTADKETNSKKQEEDELHPREKCEDVPLETKRSRTKTLKEQGSIRSDQSDTESVKSSKTEKPNKSQEQSPKTTDKKRNKDSAHSKRIRSDSTDEEVPKTARKKSKSDSPKKDHDVTPKDNLGLITEKDLQDVTGKTEYEDARSTMGLQPVNQLNLNSTYVADKPIEINPENMANCTVILEKPRVLTERPPSLTDDESVAEMKTPPKKQPKTKATKEVFSPYEKTSTKKKVEAFEKFQQASSATANTASASKTKDPGSAIKSKTKYYTPLESKIFNPSSSSTSKITRLISHASGTPNEGLSQLMTTQKESRERQRKFLEREHAKNKKEAMLLKTAEAKKKLNEEKQLKALQQRKALEAEKQKQLELQKQKEERMRQREQEREEHLMQQKMDLEKKRLAQKKKLQELQLQKQQQYEEQAKKPPIYMTTRPPPLPTDDCYDSDDPEYKKPVPPAWCTGEQARLQQLVMMTAGEKIKNTLFCRHAQTPDLTEIFQVIDPRKLKRTSSVLWRQPPRYTMMPDLNETRFSDDEDDMC